ncbi:glycosyltransferase family 2 protein [Alkalibacter rhizosphaerae]|uniref:Glycosyltransferase family 2 protein n=1 Tax=Alkalibacter rhizosphaerae TaxID=2815577 RepID=A0A975AI79_9FIRM|nr:glycosyltransferase family 2 protein [Alkalibacter rhizosphaerae]QSX09394.1 glycosyltransferase family 2 protein [Alkalibacter rhizosphaerae]
MNMTVEISVVIPTYNAERSIEEVVEGCFSILEEGKVEVILVDDGSTDATVSIIEKVAMALPNLHYLIHDKNLGQQRSIKDGMALAKGTCVVTMDDDLQQDPEEILLLWDKIQEGYDVVYGLPTRDGYPVHRAFGSKLVDLFFTWVLKKSKDVKVGSFRIMKKWISDMVVQDDREFVYITAILLDHTKNMANVAITYRERPYGTSNYDAGKLIRLFLRLFVQYGWKKKKGNRI